MLGKDSAVEWGGRHRTGLMSYWGLINSSFCGTGKILVVKEYRSFQTVYGGTSMVVYEGIGTQSVWASLWASHPVFNEC